LQSESLIFSDALLNAEVPFLKTLVFTIASIAILFAGLFFAALLPLAQGQASTEISGLITTNMTWTKQLSPWVFTGAVTVLNGVTLTIQPGASVILSTYTLTVNGTLQARGNATDPVRFTGGNTGGFDPIVFTSFSGSWNEQTATGCIIENAVLTFSGIDIEGASPKINACTFSGSDITINDASQGTPIVSNNIIKGTGIVSSIGITCGGNAAITGNNISGWQTGIDIFLGNATVTNNVVWNNSQTVSGGEGVRIDYRSDYGIQTSPTLSNNTIVYNSVGVNLVGSPTPKILYNNINNNTNYNINLYNGSQIYYQKGGSINATYNYWGTTNTATINRTIWDWKNDHALGNVTFAPFLNASNSAAPPIPVPGIFIPEFLQSPATVSMIVLVTFAALATGSVLLRGRKTQKSLDNPARL
jgi:parallel beta-helix repeat protein